MNATKELAAKGSRVANFERLAAKIERKKGRRDRHVT
jgi:hypothetical protein